LAALSRDHDVQVMLAFKVRRMTGYFELDAVTMSNLARGGCKLNLSFYDWGPHGADLLD
jgi:hypothetical protein